MALRSNYEYEGNLTRRMRCKLLVFLVQNDTQSTRYALTMHQEHVVVVVVSEAQRRLRRARCRVRRLEGSRSIKDRISGPFLGWQAKALSSTVSPGISFSLTGGDCEGECTKR